MEAKKQVKELAEKLYEGYNFKTDILKLKNTLPKYLINKAVALKYIAKLKTPALKTAYLDALNAASVEERNQKLKIAMYEKGRFYAQRIALNEVNIEYMRNKANEILSDKDIKNVRFKMSSNHPRADICDYFAKVDLYNLGAGIYPKNKAPLPPCHPFCRCRLIPLYSNDKEPKYNKTAGIDFIKSLPKYKQKQILGNKVNHFLNSHESIESIYNKKKSERYKIRTLEELNKGLEQIKANNKLIEMFKDTDFNKSGYRKSLNEPLILTKLNNETIDILKGLGFETNNDFKVMTQKELLHGMRLKKIKDGGNALSKDEFLQMPLKLIDENLYYIKNLKEVRFFWDKDEKIINYAYFKVENGIFALQTYGKTTIEYFESELKGNMKKVK